MTNEEALNVIEENLAVAIQDWDDPTDEHQEREAMGFQKAKEAIEKQIPKKPIKIENEWRDKFICPACKSEKVMTECDPYVDYGLNYCDNCGQKLDWSEVYD